MTSYQICKTCSKCGYMKRVTHEIYGDFEGFIDADREIEPKNCPVCKATKPLENKIRKLKKKIKELEEQPRDDHYSRGVI